jgi:pyruvate dehydrogenase E2 component (dihydrolipoamide acetyltransferase)
MAEVVNMPKLGFDMKEGQLIKWHKKSGDAVASGEILADIESDKATIEVESFVNGTVLQLLVNEGDWVPIGAPIMVVGQAGETVDLAALGVAAPAAEVAAPAAASANGPAAAPAPSMPVPVPEPGGNGHGLPDGKRASPLARRIAREMGLNLAQIMGSGPNGRVTRADVEAFKEGAVAAPAVAAAPRAVPSFTPVVAGVEDQAVPTSRIRTRIAARMVESKTTVPHFYVTTEIDMEAALNLRKELNAKRADDDKISVNDMIVKAAALALRQFPNINASFNGDTIVRHGHVNVGIAVALDDGLMNVVSKDADATPLTMMARTHREMVERARTGKVKPEDVEGETFAVSNLGPYDVEHFVAIINPPAAAIMAVGSAKQVPIVKGDGSLGVGWRMKATLSADHRVTDGAEGAKYMQLVKQILEDPLRLMM